MLALTIREKNMKVIKMSTAVAVSAYSLLMLTGCGGGSGGETTQDDPLDPEIVTVDPDNIPENDTMNPSSPDVLGNTNFYPNAVNTALLAGPLVGQNTVSDNVAARSVPFSYSTDSTSPIVVQRVVSASFVEDGIPEHKVIMTLKNTSNSLVCGQTISYNFVLSDGTIRSGTPSGEGLEKWHGTTVKATKADASYSFNHTSCIQPNSNIYVTREIPDVVTAEALSSVVFYSTNLYNLDSFTIDQAITNVLPTSYTIGSLPASDPRVDDPSDEFIFVNVVNNTSVSQTIPGGSTLILLDSNGYAVARLTAKAKNLTEFLAPPPLAPGAEQQIVFRNKIEVGEVSLVRFISSARPTDE